MPDPIKLYHVICSTPNNVYVSIVLMLCHVSKEVIFNEILISDILGSLDNENLYFYLISLYLVPHYKASHEIMETYPINKYKLNYENKIKGIL